MPKKRAKPGTRKIERKLLIFCEGKENKSESAYFKSLIKNLKIPVRKIDLRVVDTKVNTGKELVKIAKQEKEFKEDQLWVVYDKDGYSQHAQTFDAARRSDIQIAFSSISFEFWILLHFEYTTRAYAKSDDIIHDLKHKHAFDYSKADTEVYFSLTKNDSESLTNARKRAKQVQQYQKDSHLNTNVYDYNPYTNIDELLDSIDNFLKDT